MEPDELVVQVMLKPNCGLENTRAALIVRRVAPLCDTLSCHPSTVKSDRATIPFLRDHGLFVRFSSPTPEQVLIAIRSAFFVDHCTLVDDPDTIPSYEAADETGPCREASAFALPSTFADIGEMGERNKELTHLLERFEELHRELRRHAKTLSPDRTLNDILFAHAQAVDELRTSVARSRIEPFDRIAPSLRTLVSEYGSRFGVLADFEIADGHMALDRSVLASMEETIKRVLRSVLRDGIERPDERVAAGKNPRGLVQLRLESDGSEVTCRIEHDGRSFKPELVAQQAVESGLLTRPIETYSEEEIGALALVPGFVKPGTTDTSNMFSQFNEVGFMLQQVGGQGAVRNTDRGTLEVALHFPVPFTVMEAALVHTGAAQFALPAQQISHFEAFRPERVGTGSGSQPAHYLDEEGRRVELLNAPGTPSPFEAENPVFVLILSFLNERRALVVDAVDGYERISVRQLPRLVDRREMQAAGCFGYALLQDGTICPVASMRHLMGDVRQEGASHA